MKMPLLSALALLVASTIITACQTDSRQQVLAMDKTQVALRALQTRIFDTADHNLTVRTIIATLQDLGFTVDKVDQDLGLVSASKVDGSLLKMTVTARPRGDSQVVVRASAQHRLKAISDPLPYQRFFDSLSQALFLEAHEV